MISPQPVAQRNNQKHGKLAKLSWRGMLYWLSASEPLVIPNRLATPSSLWDTVQSRSGWVWVSRPHQHSGARGRTARSTRDWIG